MLGEVLVAIVEECNKNVPEVDGLDVNEMAIEDGDGFIGEMCLAIVEDPEVVGLVEEMASKDGRGLVDKAYQVSVADIVSEISLPEFDIIAKDVAIEYSSGNVRVVIGDSIAGMADSRDIGVNDEEITAD